MIQTSIAVVALVASTVSAQAPLNNQADGPQQLIAAQAFFENPGVVEFSGRMIVRPRQDLFGATNPASGARASDVDAVPNARQVLPDLQDPVPTDRARARIAEHVIEHFGEVDEYVVALPAGHDENTYARLLMQTGDYEYVEPDWICYTVDTIPNDPQFGSSWQHTRLESTRAWDITTGSPDAIVAIVDSGIDLDHPDLVSNLVLGFNSFTNQSQSSGADVNDYNGHGTFCAGVAAATGNNGTQVVGVGWNLGIMPIRATNGSAGTAFSSDLNQGARWAAENGAVAINVSYSGASSSSVQSTAAYCKNFGATYFRSAGNSGALISNFDHADAIIVGASTSSDGRAGFSNYGVAIDVFAPGASVRGTFVGGGTGTSSGTSFASPIAAGVAAMIYSVNPFLSPDQIQQILYNTCDDLGATGEDSTFGHGRVNTFQAVLAALSTTQSPPIILSDPASFNGCESQTDSLVLSVETNSETFDIQWYKNGLSIPGETGDQLDLGTITSAIDGSYFARVSNAFGQTDSENALVMVNPAPSLMTDVADVTVAEGEEAVFTFELNGNVNFVTWLFNGLPIGGQNGDTLSIPGVVASFDGATVQAIVDSDCGSVDSRIATLTVSDEQEPCLADVNMNGSVEPTDFGAWLTAYNNDDPAADQNQNGSVEPTDFGAWLSNYNAGCG